MQCRLRLAERATRRAETPLLPADCSESCANWPSAVSCTTRSTFGPTLGALARSGWASCTTGIGRLSRNGDMLATNPQFLPRMQSPMALETSVQPAAFTASLKQAAKSPGLLMRTAQNEATPAHRAEIRTSSSPQLLNADMKGIALRPSTAQRHQHTYQLASRYTCDCLAYDLRVQ